MKQYLSQTGQKFFSYRVLPTFVLYLYHTGCAATVHGSSVTKQWRAVVYISDKTGSNAQRRPYLFRDGGNSKAAGSELRTMPTVPGRFRPSATTVIRDLVQTSSGGKTRLLVLLFVSNTPTPKSTAVLLLWKKCNSVAVKKCPAQLQTSVECHRTEEGKRWDSQRTFLCYFLFQSHSMSNRTMLSTTWQQFSYFLFCKWITTK